MTINRAILIIMFFIGGSFVLLGYGNPQWKWCHMFQVSVWPRNTVKTSTFGGVYGFRWGYFPTEYETLVIPKSFTGIWRDWDSSGNLIFIRKIKDGIMVDGIYCKDSDRRTEFGIEVE